MFSVVAFAGACVNARPDQGATLPVSPIGFMLRSLDMLPSDCRGRFCSSVLVLLRHPELDIRAVEDEYWYLQLDPECCDSKIVPFLVEAFEREVRPRATLQGLQICFEVHVREATCVVSPYGPLFESRWHCGLDGVLLGMRGPWRWCGAEQPGAHHWRRSRH
jgi:hypothetical protein